MIAVKAMSYTNGQHVKCEISVGELTATYLDLRSTQVEAALAWHCKPSQLHVVGEIINPRGKSTIAMLQNQSNS